MKNDSRNLALGGVMAALGAMFMLLGGGSPAATFCAPALAGLALVPVFAEGGAKLALGAYAAIAALRDGDNDVADMRESYNQRRRFVLKRLEEIGIPCFEPEGAFYLFPNISRFGMSSETFCTELLKSQKVAVVPGNAFGDCGEGFVRISYAYSLKQLKEALRRIENYVRELDSKAGSPDQRSGAGKEHG